MEAALRLFVGGLPDGCTQAELEQRFSPFGKVTECDIVGPKTYSGGLAFPRGFGYISLLPKDDQALKSCLSTYNGCKWRGKVLRCQVAKQRYAERLQAEVQAPPAEVRHATRMRGYIHWRCYIHACVIFCDTETRNTVLLSCRRTSPPRPRSRCARASP